MGGVTLSQRDAILTKAEALAGEPLGEAVAAVLVGLASRESDVKSITRGDTSVTYLDGKNAESVLLAPWCRLGTLREG
ncbi:hypothetical protein [Oscillibacter sp. MSJ-31]|uniref:hypothetical protein n=1 Tax=Oscillibacter sp. MSJ-31 TaxID=2841526 RepID=UPI001C100F55|nr:hypothetical protein [Oscillibacter sp. MSJ-31]MBU5458076.1 hypothetical protein [Oscillibacter sp. MSJ-31]